MIEQRSLQRDYGKALKYPHCIKYSVLSVRVTSRVVSNQLPVHPDSILTDPEPVKEAL